VTDTYKEAVLDKEERKIVFESKMKATFKGTVHEGIIKNNGEMSYEFIWDQLGKTAGVEGLKFQTKCMGNARPSEEESALVMGINYSNEKTKFLTGFNVRKGDNETTAVYHCCKAWLFGGNFIYNVAKKRFTTYTAAALWQPADNCLVGVQHSSLDDKKGKLEPYRKFNFYFWHQASSADTVGTEFIWNWSQTAKKEPPVEIKLGVTHKFSDENTGKIKVNQLGVVDLVLKHKFSEALNVTGTTSFNVDGFKDEKHGGLPFGIGFNINY